MTPAAEATLAMLLLIQQPGKSPYSRIAVESCDEACRVTPLCSEEQLYCRPPRWSPSKQAFYRYETWDEGVRRYALIAEVMADAAGKMTRTDSNPGGVWTGSSLVLRRLLATIAGHESGYRRDVHEGVTRGDCDYRMVRGEREIIPGSCRSSCLGQIQIGPEKRTARGYSADELVGLDRASTFRCIETMVDRLSQARRACTAQQRAAGDHAGCTFGIYGGVASWSGDDRIKLRLQSYRELKARPLTLSQRVRDALAASE